MATLEADPVPQQLSSHQKERRTFLGVERSVTGRRWVERLDPESGRLAQAIAQKGGVSDILARVLAGRGVDVTVVDDFLDPALKRLMPDPSSLTDMDAAAARIADAVVRGEAIAVFGDYDVDGASSAAVLQRFLRSLGRDTQIYIPDRIFEGYGPNEAAMKSLAGDGNRLVVCVDCGSTSFTALAEARQLGLDVVVIDHHQVGTDLPVAAAVVNPNRQDDLSGLGHLAAVGVTFLATVALNRELRRRGFFTDSRTEPDLLQWLDLVALGTVCDVVPLVGLNRAFVTKGLRAMARRANRGLAALADVARLGGPIAPYHLGFLLGPRINAGGRIGDAALGARLLACDEPAECEALAAELDRLNRERQALETMMLEEAYAEAEAEIASGGGPAILVTASETWHPGVVGLIASRLKDRFQRPAIAIAFRPDGLGSGSGRSIAGVDLGRAVRLAVDRGILAKGGGHAMAAGLTVKQDRLADLRAFLGDMIAVSENTGRAGDLLIDAALTARGATVEMIEAIDRAGPFGAGHAEPVFAFPAHRIAYADSGDNGHVRLSLAAPDGAKLKAIAFRAAGTDLGRALEARRGQALHVAGYLSVDRWQGRALPSLRVVDAAVPDH
ncbi:MAG: single-stranded-DNA-specific exonuclease RecJ [Hyphomicrobiales bacterium]|nr:single-stranded-DNA-specific exonuclease RecJ [Hyphomicrobiales bacterium]